MNESFPPPSPGEQTQNEQKKRGPEIEVQIMALDSLFIEVETAFANEGREKAKSLLPGIYNNLMALNKRGGGDWQTQWAWNPDGDLTEKEFDRLNLRRKLLSNAIGIMTASGTVRHDLNEI